MYEHGTEVVYISGLIASPLPAWAAPEQTREWFVSLFGHAAGGIRQQGYWPLNPLTIEACQYRECNGSRIPEDDNYEHSWECYMRHDIEAIMAEPRCRTILMLPGHSQSRGAQTELELCRALGFDVYVWLIDHVSGQVGFHHQRSFADQWGRRSGDRRPMGTFVPFEIKEAS